MNFTFKEGDLVIHKNMGLVEMPIVRVFPKAKHVVWIRGADGSNIRAQTVDLIRVLRPSDVAAKSEIALHKLHRKQEKEEFQKMVEARRKRFQDHVDAGGRLKADGTPDRRVRKLKTRSESGTKIVWVGRR
jgi:hypothetical protein